MKFKLRIVTITVLLGLLLASGIYHGVLFGATAPEAVRQNGPVSLQAPPFVHTAYAQGDPTQSIVDEAGMSAYFQAPGTIDLSDVRGLYRTIETDTGSYIIGSMAVTGYGEPHDAHVYVHVDGWVLAYYFNDEPVGKIFDTLNYTGGPIQTKLEIILGIVANSIGIGSNFTPIYYDFRYPDATNLLLVGDYTPSYATDEFTMKLPDIYTYYERSWAFSGSGGSSFQLNGVTIASGGTASWGTFTPTQLPPNQTHTITLLSCSYCGPMKGAVLLVYGNVP
ncbi:MAG: hypothetical protein KF770_18710 [Anaerolineae bacterium]|nr:hypothetical protein [Anaerolineae bacterium]